MAYQVPVHCEMTRVIRKLQMVMDETTRSLAATETYQREDDTTRKMSTHTREKARKTAMHACGIVGRRPRVRLYRSSYDGHARLRANVYEAWLCSECEIRTLTLPTLTIVEDRYYE